MTAGKASSSAKEERKLRKPLIERKRRERINHCLDQLRETVVGAFNLDQSKLEKADILEMTVKHLQNIQSSKEPRLDAEAHQRYSTGYIQCVHEVHTLLLSCEWIDKTLGSRLLHHLLKSLPRAASDCTGSHEPFRAVLTDQPRFHGNEEDGLMPCPLSPVSSPPECRPPPTESPQLTTLEMWRPW
ncbi:transcription cofactor HES-6-like isoform X2 [Hoplias malabaricus]|uniref:transcription cofactor HES-6-like isoform X2 n=1 Tax=Hoplias malabaricus TaxID=27720 RepID=UPI0034635FDF